MALGIRGSNPIWLEVDLQGKLFDDTFYLFVLENTIPYIPATVYHDPDLNAPWTNPIRFFANGTLPIDIYFESEVVYRLEFRQGPTQQDPLIYEVDNYVAGSGGSTPVNTVAFASSNQVTNPQFALFNLQNPVTISGTNPAPIELAPGWVLEVAGTGSVIITQVALNDGDKNPSNAPYALQLTLSGWTADSVVLRQRFEQNGMLWANKIVSTTLTARLEGTPQSVSANLVDSNNSLLATVLDPTTINGEWNEFTDYGTLPETTNPNDPPSAYIDYRLLLPSNVDIYLTSIQLVVQDLPFKPDFEQDSINRQIDHTYNTAYPIVPVGTVIDYAGFRTPDHYYLCDGSAKNRVRDYLLFTALTTTETVTLTNGVNTFTVASNANYHIGMLIEGTGIPATTTISNIVGTTITMSANATATGPSSVRFFAWGAADTATFNLPNLQGYATAGANGSLFTNNGPGTTGGAATHTLTVDEIPSHHHSGLFLANPLANTGGPGAFVAFTTTQINTGDTGGGLAHSIVQPTALVRKCIRFE